MNLLILRTEAPVITPEGVKVFFPRQLLPEKKRKDYTFWRWFYEKPVASSSDVEDSGKLSGGYLWSCDKEGD